MAVSGHRTADKVVPTLHHWAFEDTKLVETRCETEYYAADDVPKESHDERVLEQTGAKHRALLSFN